METPAIVGMNGHDAIVIAYAAQVLGKKNRQIYPTLKHSHQSTMPPSGCVGPLDQAFMNPCKNQPRYTYMVCNPNETQLQRHKMVDYVHGGQITWKAGIQNLPRCLNKQGNPAVCQKEVDRLGNFWRTLFRNLGSTSWTKGNLRAYRLTCWRMYRRNQQQPCIRKFTSL